MKSSSDMSTREVITISLPPVMIQAVERVRKAEHRTRSGSSVRRELEKGRAAMRRGNYYTLDQFRAWLLERPTKRA